MKTTVHFRVALLASLLIAALALTGVPATAQSGTESCTFQYLAPESGQRIWQHVTALANLTTTHEQFGQKIAQENRTISQEQIRRLEILEFHRLTDKTSIPSYSKVRVQYEKAQESAMQSGLKPVIQDQPVHEKAYIVWREDGELQVSSENGEEVSREEITIVRRNMQAIGRSNPLAQFLNGRTITVGEQLEMPSDLAGELLAWKPEYGQLQQAILKLSTIRELAGTQCGIFHAELSGAPVLGSPIGTKLAGDISVEIATCRTVSVDMKAKLHSREERGPTGNTFFVNHRGRASLHTQSRFLKIRR